MNTVSIEEAIGRPNELAFPVESGETIVATRERAYPLAARQERKTRLRGHLHDAGELGPLRHDATSWLPDAGISRCTREMPMELSRQ